MTENTEKKPISERLLAGVALASAALSVIAFLLVSTPVFVLLSFLVIPVLILIAAPTVALWTLTLILFLSAMKRFAPPRWSLVLASAATLAVLTAIPMLANLAAYRPYQEVMAVGDILPKQQVTLAGNILIRGPQIEEEWRRSPDRDSKGNAETRPWACNELCMTVLDAPGVASVTLDTLDAQERPSALSKHARTYRLVLKAQCPAKTSLPHFGSGASDARWDLRLSTELCLVAGPALVRADQVIEQQTQWLGDETSENKRASAWSFGPQPVRVERLEVRDSPGRVLLRRSIVRGEVNTVPLIIGLEDGWKGPTYFRWGRTDVFSASSRFATIEPIKILRRHASLRAAPEGAPALAALRDRLEALVAQPSISEDDPAFGLIDVWFDELGKSKDSASERDIALMESIVAHPSITEYYQMYPVTDALNADGLQRLRKAIARRIAGTDKPGKWIKGLASLYSRLPPGGAYPLNPDEKKILADPDRRKYAPELMLRESERGEEAVPLLMAWLRFHTYANRNRGDDKSDGGHINAIDAVRRGLCVLGPNARSALPEVETMMANGAVPMALGDADDWRFVLARLGKPVDAISKPPNRSETPEYYRAHLVRKLQMFDAKKSCRANWM